MITGFSAGFIPVPDVEKAKEWYEQYLDLTWNGYCFTVPSGPAIFLTQYDERWGLQAVSFIVPDAERLHNNLMTNGIRVEAMREIAGIGREFDFYDLCDNKLQATQQN